MPVITNRFPKSRCTACGGNIYRGESLYFAPEGTPGHQVYCIPCHDKAYARTKDKPQPEAPPPPPKPQGMMPAPHDPPFTPAPEPVQDEAKAKAFARTIITAILDEEASQWKDDITAKVTRAIEPIARKIAAEIIGDTEKRVIRLERRDGTRVKITGAHPLMGRIMRSIANGRRVYIWGPRGTGKTHLLLQAAEALGITPEHVYLESVHPYFTPHGYTGYNDAKGDYCKSSLYRFLTDTAPCMYICDEFDRQRSDAPSVLNSLTAQGFIMFPNGERVDLLDGHYIVAAGNTAMRGGSTAYSAASRQELSTTDRWKFIHLPIDTSLERSIASGLHPVIGPIVHTWVMQVRAYIARPENRTIQDDSPSPRTTYDMVRSIVQDGDTIADAAESDWGRGIGPDIMGKVLAACPLPEVPEV